jgi:hypothetical protein
MATELAVVETLEQLAELLRDHGSALYIRYSHGPLRDVGQPSIDYESGLQLPGLSVNPLMPETWWTRPIADWLARQVCNYAHLQDADDRSAWVLEGEVVARGPDNEPLLSPARHVARACSGPARGGAPPVRGAVRRRARFLSGDTCRGVNGHD